jgi:RNA polymerase sigma-70 factor (ECF subfamily)
MTSSSLSLLLEHRARLLSFVRSRVASRETAEDLLQTMYARIAADPAVVPSTHPLPWVYRVLRNAITDHHRRTTVETRRQAAWEADPTTKPTVEAGGRLCRCTLQALASLKPEYRCIIEEVEIHGRSVVDVGRESGLSSTNAYVRLHRARRQLAERLRGICRSCADRACVDCHCKGSEAPA